MKVLVKNLKDSQKEVLVETEGDEVAPYLEKASFRLSENLNIPGFRSGRVPFKVLKDKIDPMKIYEEAAKILIPEFYVKALLEKEIEAIGRPQVQITRLVPGKGISFKATTDILPEVKLPNYNKIKVEKEKVKVDEKDVEEELKNIQRKRAKFITKEKAAEKGDRVEIDFESLLGKVPLEGGKSQNHPLIIGESHFVKGFDEKLIGLKAGDKKKFFLVFPDNFLRKNLAGKKVSFKVKMKLVQKRILEKIDDEFARSLGRFNNLKDLKKSLFEGILEERERRAGEKAQVKVVGEIIKKTEFSKIPQILFEAELQKIINEFKTNLANFKVDFKNYLEKIGKDESRFRDEMMPEAELRVKRGLVLKKVAEKEKIKVSEKEIEEKINETLKYYKNKEEVRKKLDLNQLKEYTKNILLNQKTMDFLEKAAVKQGVSN